MPRTQPTRLGLSRQLAADVGAGGGLPVLPGVRRVEEVGLGQEVPEDRGPALAEGGLGDVGVLAAYGGDVHCVSAVGRRQDREIGVREGAAGGVAVGGAMG